VFKQFGAFWVIYTMNDCVVIHSQDVSISNPCTTIIVKREKQDSAQLLLLQQVHNGVTVVT